MNWYTFEGMDWVSFAEYGVAAFVVGFAVVYGAVMLYRKVKG